jgi:hypothetical protein
MDPANLFVGVEDSPRPAVSRYALIGTSPNPFRSAVRIRYALPQASGVRLDVFDVQGRQVASRELGVQAPGTRDAVFADASLRSGVYLYRLHFSDPATGAARASLAGKMMRLR